MKKQIIVIIGLFLVLASVSIGQTSLRGKIRKLELGKTNLDEIKKLFGEPDRVKETSAYVRDEPSLEHEIVYLDIKSKYPRHIKDAPVRHLSLYSYDKIGLEFYLLDTPSELTSFVIKNPRLWSHGIHIGDSLATVKKVIGKNDNWWSTEGSNDWTLEYSKLGVRFYFPRDPKVPQFPFKLKQEPSVTSIEIFDKRIVFVG